MYVYIYIHTLVRRCILSPGEDKGPSLVTLFAVSWFLGALCHWSSAAAPNCLLAKARGSGSGSRCSPGLISEPLLKAKGLAPIVYKDYRSGEKKVKVLSVKQKTAKSHI